MCWMMPKVGVEATGSVPLGAPGAVRVETVVVNMARFFVALTV